MIQDANEAPPRRSTWLSIGFVWVLVALASLVVLLLAPHGSRMQWFPIILGLSTILAFCLQLALDSKVGFVNRLMTTVTGSVVILALATGATALAGGL
jgi:O-antigen ligase